MKTIIHTILFLFLSYISVGQSLDSIETSLSAELFSKVNAYRTSKGLDTVMEDDFIVEFSKEHAIDMSDSGAVFHSKSKYSECAHRVYYGTFVASSDEDALSYIFERNPDIPGTILKSWKGSKNHNKIILKSATMGGLYIDIKITKGKACFPKGSNVYKVEFFTAYNVYDVGKDLMITD